jgi:NADH:ubiquinone oxidoreductase subunit E
MGLSAAHVAATATFYTMLNKKPVGSHLVQICTNIACSLLGSDHLIDHISSKLGIGVGETTPDGQFTLLEVECLGSCGTAPVMQIGDRYYEDLTVEKIDRILAELA